MSVLGVRDCVGGKPLDALIDAAQLRCIAPWPWLRTLRMIEHAGRAAVQCITVPESGDAVFWATAAARHAFRACPALREEA